MRIAFLISRHYEPQVENNKQYITAVGKIAINRNLQWISKYDNDSRFTVFILNSGEELTGFKNIINIPKVKTRTYCDYNFYYYICKNYEKLNDFDIYIVLQAWPHDHIQNFEERIEEILDYYYNNNLQNYKKIQLGHPMNEWFFWNKKQSNIIDLNKEYVFISNNYTYNWCGTDQHIVKYYNFQNYGQYFKDILYNDIQWNEGWQFIVRTKDLLFRSKKFYFRMLKSVIDFKKQSEWKSTIFQEFLANIIFDGKTRDRITYPEITFKVIENFNMYNLFSLKNKYNDEDIDYFILCNKSINNIEIYKNIDLISRINIFYNKQDDLFILCINKQFLDIVDKIDNRCFVNFYNGCNKQETLLYFVILLLNQNSLLK